MKRQRDHKLYVNQDESPRIKVGISTCLLGMAVRFDGGHKHDSYLTQTLGRYFDWVSVCPEVDMGMSIPRENIRLVGEVDDPRLKAPKSGTDYTDQMKNWTKAKLHEFENMDLHGYILKKDSPSCGMERVRVYDENNVPKRQGIGVFARALLDKFPLLPIEEEGRLKDARLRENFIERIFAHYRLQELLRSNPSNGDIVEFHTRHKLTLMAHHQKTYNELGRMTANIKDYDRYTFFNQYNAKFMAALKRKATIRTHTNVLHHIMGFFKKHISTEERQELLDLIEQYREGLLPLIAPIILIKHFLYKLDIDWLDKQVYLNPYPSELMLRNFI
ncbi:MAG: DUF1722 domain-containing protein [Caldithrix sp.]|nr:DUF1722 domain-containing protein [Caldithrix sp.]